MAGVVILIMFSLSLWSKIFQNFATSHWRFNLLESFMLKVVVAENEKTDIHDVKIWNSTKVKGKQIL